MSYIPHSDQDRILMLKELGLNSLDQLFHEIPEHLKLKKELNIPCKLNEQALFDFFLKASNQNTHAAELDWFLGAGLYDRYIPSVVGAVLSRGEFLTAYTPYQPELSQGYLQTIYEFQSMIAEFYGMEVSNASVYDGATASAEAALMAARLTGKHKILVSKTLHPHYKEVLKTYCWASSLEFCEIEINEKFVADHNTACFILQTPNFYGILENLAQAKAIAIQKKALLIVISDPVAMGLLKPPGEYGADIVVGEGQQLGIPMSFGGPLLGLFTTKKEYIRSMPGRIVGRTRDKKGKTGYAMTLRTREQDIRREKSTSNICTNQALMALAATVYLTALGKNGIRSIATSTVQNAQYAAAALTKVGAKMKFNGKFFGEFVLELPENAAQVRDELLDHSILAGLPLGDFEPDLKNCLLVAVTEIRTKKQIDRFAEKLEKVIS